jgi:hypothetical protein
MSEKIVTGLANPFLAEAFRAFQAEGLPLPLAAEMVKAHVAHAVGVEQAKALNRLADAAEKVAKLADPVLAGEFIAFLKAAEVKRTENKDARKDEEARAALESALGMKPMTNEELAG